jgi:hypothetical protein
LLRRHVDVVGREDEDLPPTPANGVASSVIISSLLPVVRAVILDRDKLVEVRKIQSANEAFSSIENVVLRFGPR